MGLDEIKEMIQDAGVGYLATVEGNEPRVRPMMPGVFSDGTLYLATAKGSPKLSQIEKNSNCEMSFIDKRLSQVRVRGKARIDNDIKKKEWLSNAVPMLRSYFPTPSDPNFVLLEFKPTKVLLIHIGEQEYTEVKI